MIQCLRRFLGSFLIFFVFLSLFLTGCSHASKRHDPPLKPEGAPVKKQAVIVIDPGHGGKDVGAESKSKPKKQEKSLNLTTAHMVNRYLKKMGYQTIITRGEDFFVPLELRAAFANSNHATLFVSVHYNAAPSPEAEGVEVYYYEGENNKERTLQSKKLAKKVLDSITANTVTKSRGVKKGDFAVIRETKMPAILVEGGFITNEEEMKRLRDPEHLRKTAFGIAIGIHEFLTHRK